MCLGTVCSFGLEFRKRLNLVPSRGWLCMDSRTDRLDLRWPKPGQPKGRVNAVPTQIEQASAAETRVTAMVLTL